MKFLEKIILKNLRKDSQGRAIFYPWGDFGSGYLVDSPVTLKKVRNFLYLSWILPVLFLAFLILTYITGDLFSNPFFFLILIVAAPIFLLCFLISVNYLTKNLPISQKRPGFLGFLRKKAKTVNIALPIFWVVFPFYWLVRQIQTFISEQEHSWKISYFIFHGVLFSVSIGLIFIFGYMLFIRIFKK